MLASYLIGLVLRFAGSAATQYGQYNQYMKSYLRIALVLVAIHLAINKILGLYGQMWHHASVLEARRVLLAGVIAMVVILALDMVLHAGHHRLLPLAVIVLGGGLSLAGFSAIRFQSRLFAFRRREHDAESRPQGNRALLMGVGSAGATVLRDVVRDRSLGLEVVGLVDDDRANSDSRCKA